MSTTAAAIALANAFATRKGSPAFSKMTVKRPLFAADLITRINDPGKINQGATSLCGPASFLFSVARWDPEAYARYVIDLFEIGEAKIKDLKVKPGKDCLEWPGTSGIDAVDWVALASLRDSDNTFLDYQEPDDAVAGITLPGKLASWFDRAGHPTTRNRTNLMFDKGLMTLLKAHQRFCAGEAVCLFIGANVLEKDAGGKMVPDHWVVLTSQITIDGVSATTLRARGPSVGGDAKVLAGHLEFDVFTWGQGARRIDYSRPKLKVETFLDYFYGYVAAK